MTLAVLLMLISTVVGYPIYQTYIPNGQHVPNPCQPNMLWPGVGHENPAGGGPRNPFGIDFGLHQHVTNNFDMCDLANTCVPSS
jgi:hypothetical protein